MLRLAIWAILNIVLVQTAFADSYGPFQDRIEVDRHGMFFAQVRGSECKSSADITITISTRLSSEAEAIRLAELQKSRSSPLELTSGPIRTVFNQQFDFQPNLIRISNKCVALLDYHAINFRQLQRDPAIQVFEFNGTKRRLSFKLDDVFSAGVRRYHNGRGRVTWLRDAWFDGTGDRLILVSEPHITNPHNQEVAIISLKDGQVLAADSDTVKNLLLEADDRFLHVAFEAAQNYSVAGIKTIAERLFQDAHTPLAAKARAAAYLQGLGNVDARELLNSLAALRSVEASQIRHPLISPSQLDEIDFWVNTILYAAEVQSRNEK